MTDIKKNTAKPCETPFKIGYPLAEDHPLIYIICQDSVYYASIPTQEAYDNLYELYRQDGLSDEEISQILVLDIKDADYFESQGVTVQHGGGNLFARDQEIMNWLFSKQK